MIFVCENWHDFLFQKKNKKVLTQFSKLVYFNHSSGKQQPRQIANKLEKKIDKVLKSSKIAGNEANKKIQPRKKQCATQIVKMKIIMASVQKELINTTQVYIALMVSFVPVVAMFSLILTNNMK